MAQLMLINPRKRRASSKRKAAAPKRRRTYKRVAAKTNPVAPIRRRRHHRVAVKARHHRRIRRNPIGLGGIGGQLMNAGIGAVGAVAVDTIYNYLPLPATMKVGAVGTASKVALALAVGILGKKLVGNSAEKMAAGSLTVIAYDLVKSFMPPSLPAPVISPAVSGLGYMSPGINGGYLPQQGMGEYFGFANSNAGMGEYITGYN